jgi:hypothetical protein
MSIVGLPVLLLPVSSAVRSSLVLIVAGMFIVSCWAGNDGDIEGVKYHMYQRPVIMPSIMVAWYGGVRNTVCFQPRRTPSKVNSDRY